MNPINEVQDIWAYLRTTPLLWLMLTMMAYLLGFWCFEKVKRSPIVSPVAIAASFFRSNLTDHGHTIRCLF